MISPCAGRPARSCLRRAVPGLAVAALLLAGCSPAGTDRAAAGSLSDAAGPSATPVASPTLVPASPVPSDPAVPPPTDQPPVLVLRGDGLDAVAADASTVTLAFGSPGDAVQDAVEQAVGPLTPTSVSCPQGPRTELAGDGFTVLLDGSAFVGWADEGAPDRSLTSADGIGTGSPLSDLRSALPGTVVAPATGGPTWSSGTGLSGRLSGDDAAARVTTLAAGQTCGS